MAQDNTMLQIYLNDIAKTKLLTQDEEIALFQALHAGDTKAKEKIIKANLRLVVSLSRKFMGQGLPFMDIVQEGNIGLMKAVDKFDINKGIAFSTYATPWIYSTIKRGMTNTTQLIRVPEHMVTKLRLYKRAYTALNMDLHREPTSLELADYMDLTEAQIEQIKDVLNSEVPVSLDFVVGESLTIADVVPDIEEHTPAFGTDNTCLTDDVYKMIKTLDDREQFVMIHKYGLFGVSDKSNVEIAPMIKVGAEQVRRIHNCAMDKLKALKGLKNVHGYIMEEI